MCADALSFSSLATGSFTHSPSSSFFVTPSPVPGRVAMKSSKG
jgi:hypothetical protein